MSLGSLNLTEMKNVAPTRENLPELVLWILRRCGWSVFKYKWINTMRDNASPLVLTQNNTGKVTYKGYEQPPKNKNTIMMPNLDTVSI